MPVQYTNDPLNFADEKSPSTYTTPMYTFAMGIVLKGTDDAPELRSLWLGALTGSGSVNRYVQADYTVALGWVVNDDLPTLSPSGLNTELKSIPVNFVGASVPQDDYELILEILGL